MNRIKEILQEKDLTQVWLANQLEKSFKMVNAYACNRKQPSLETLFVIAGLLDVSVKSLIIDNKRKNHMNTRIIT
jgi:transcriptional regulator with XRE-family HTH domain